MMERSGARVRWTTLSFTLAALACARTSPAVVPPSAVAVQIVADEADAVLAILARRRAAQPIADLEWGRLFDSEGYRRLKSRELGINRPFTDSGFRLFVLSDTLLARHDALQQAVTSYRAINIARDAQRALAYLPDGGSIHARLYLEIKPITNSFVVFGSGGPGIFLYVDPAVSRERAERDIVTHEMHHIGFSESCGPDTATPSPRETARQYAGALGEGLAMLAAAGAPDVDPHEFSSPAVRDRWHRDLARWQQDFPDVERFLVDVAEGRLVTRDSIMARAGPFWGDAQGPWYTVGYMVGTTIERARGRDVLRRIICDRAKLLAEYNSIARDTGLPTWSEHLIALLRPQ
jgi:Putative zinc dependent peptidase (DUF5700)